MPIPRSLHLTSLKLRNFKGIAELHLAFDESLTLLAGVNGVGKTSSRGFSIPRSVMMM